MSILLGSGGGRALLSQSTIAAGKRRPVLSAATLLQSRRLRGYRGMGDGGNVKRGMDEMEQRVVVIMGATGTGKSKLSVQLSSIFSGEVINCDKIQVYRGLDITTNKMPVPDRRGVPHHLLGELDPATGELPRTGFRVLASCAIEDISARGRIPMVAGGSNSFIHALLSDRFDPRSDPFGERSSARKEALRSRCCLIWVHVDAAVLAEQLDRRVDEMVVEGMVEELERYFAVEGEAERHPGLGKKEAASREERDRVNRESGERASERFLSHVGFHVGGAHATP
ncbi:adenylate isopentenyltransferase 8, chloroplastic-like, partial [Curcuma longa]|uniref:adenylate isopentenyltransferase 8, chloroplastic-like n=1 Tax=Curcuma longa TaxID=136217 RepID=UPI003D9ED48F